MVILTSFYIYLVLISHLGVVLTIRAQSQFIILIRVRTAPPVSVRVKNRVSVSFSSVSFSLTIYHAPRVVHVNPYRHSAPYSQCVPAILTWFSRQFSP